MSVETSHALNLNRPGGPRLRKAFFVVWMLDLVATTQLFLVPYARELNPITVLFYESIGLTGVVLAAVSYAAIIVTIGYVLSRPFDVGFVTAVVSCYAFFASNNFALLLFRKSLVETPVV